MTPFPCQTEDPALWFPESGPATRAKRLCRGCPNRLPCLRIALKHHVEYGIFGGTSPAERKRLSPGDAPPEIKLVHPNTRNRTCERAGCERKHHSGGLCNKHLLQARRAERKAAA
jgi:WhiB family redox-sensing transcriptional regulator